MYPSVDPIPLPAPVWLLKLLHVVTLSLHFVAVEMLLGRPAGGGGAQPVPVSPHAGVAARALARRLTVVMTFVINLGVPPLLFAQVLYGRALYTSSVLIGIYWIAIVPVLMLTYWLLYQFSARLEGGQIGVVGGTAGVAAGGRHCAHALNQYDADAAPRGMAANVRSFGDRPLSAHGRPHAHAALAAHAGRGLFMAGLWLIYLSGRSTFTADEKKFVAGLGGKLAAGFGVVYLLAGLWAANVQPEAVKAGLAGQSIYPLYRLSGLAGYGWIALVAVAVVLGLIAGFGKIAAAWLSWAGVLAAVLVEIMFTVYRDGARDLTLLRRIRRMGSRRRHQLERGWTVPGSVCRRTGCHCVAGLGRGSCAKSDGRSGLSRRDQ